MDYVSLMTIGTPFSVIISTTSSQVNFTALDQIEILVQSISLVGGWGGGSGSNDYGCVTNTQS